MSKRKIESPAPSPQISVQDLLGIIGSQTVELTVLRGRVQQLEQALALLKQNPA